MKVCSLVPLGLLAAVICGTLAPASGQVVLLDDVFTSPYSGWVDGYPDRNNGSNWRLSLHNPTLMETHNSNPPTPDSPAVANTGIFQPSVLFQDNFVAPENYNLTARMYTNDDDIMGLVFNYEDADNYFRVGIRQQAAGSFGGTQGVSVQKFVNGVMTQIFPFDPGDPKIRPYDTTTIDNRVAFDLGVVVENGTFDILFDGTSVLPNGPIADSDLTGGGKIGFQSWAQSNRTGSLPHWGTEVEEVTVSDATGVLYNQTFEARPTQWRALNMKNSSGAGPSLAEGGVGSFGIDINHNRILQVSNSFQYATTTAPNVDFVGAAMVVDEPGSENYGNYEMRVRMAAGDNDGIGVLLRVQDDDTYYRINFANEAMGASGQRTPRGMSFQKVINGVWSELFRDDQDNPAFVHFSPSGGPNDPTPISIIDPRDPMNPDDDEEAYIDLAVRAIGNTFQVSVTGWDVISQTFKSHTYDLIVDDTDPLLTGTVGLTSWGNTNSFWSAYGGGTHPFLTAIPEPSTVALAALAGLGLVGWVRRRRA